MHKWHWAHKVCSSSFSPVNFYMFESPHIEVTVFHSRLFPVAPFHRFQACFALDEIYQCQLYGLKRDHLGDS